MGYVQALAQEKLRDPCKTVKVPFSGGKIEMTCGEYDNIRRSLKQLRVNTLQAFHSYLMETKSVAPDFDHDVPTLPRQHEAILKNMFIWDHMGDESMLLMQKDGSVSCKVRAVVEYGFAHKIAGKPDFEGVFANNSLCR